jgi:hypothetical protein
LQKCKWEIGQKLSGHSYVEELKFPNGVYRGYILDGKKDGPGTFKWENESVYNGDFSEDDINGFGEIKHKDGSWYKGDWKNNKATK